MSEESHKDFMLCALRAASLRAKMIEMDLNTVGVALKSDMVTPMEAVKWLRQIGALDFVGKIPAAIVGESRRRDADMETLDRV